MEKINCVRYLVIILITAIFIIAFINHIVVNMRCETIMEGVSENLLDIKNCIVEIRNDTCLLSGIKRQDMDSIQVNKLLRDFDTQREGILASINEMHKQSSYLFDANTVTFLVSFALALLFTALFFMHDKISQHIKVIQESETMISKFKDETKRTVENVLHGIKQQNCVQKKHIAICQIFSGVSILSHFLATNQYKISNDILTLVYMLDREVKSLLNDKASVCEIIELTDKRKLVELLYDCINYLDINRLEGIQSNKNKLTSIQAFNNNLLILKGVIEDIPEFSSDNPFP